MRNLLDRRPLYREPSFWLMALVCVALVAVCAFAGCASGQEGRVLLDDGEALGRAARALPDLAIHARAGCTLRSAALTVRRDARGRALSDAR